MSVKFKLLDLENFSYQVYDEYGMLLVLENYKFFFNDLDSIYDFINKSEVGNYMELYFKKNSFNPKYIIFHINDGNDKIQTEKEFKLFYLNDYIIDMNKDSALAYILALDSVLGDLSFYQHMISDSTVGNLIEISFGYSNQVLFQVK